MNTESSKTKHSFNIIDVLIIAGIMAVAFFGIYMFSGDIFESRIHTVEYCIKLDGVSDINAVNELEVGERLFSTNMNIPAGIIKKISSENMKITVYDKPSGRYTVKENSGVYSVYIYVDAGCVFENGGYRTENIRVSENTEIEVNVPFLYDSALIIDVNSDSISEDN